MLTKWMMFVLCIKSQASSQVGVVLLGVLMSIVLKVPAGDECAPWWTVIQIVGIHVECIIMKSSQCRLILHTVSVMGPRNHGVASSVFFDASRHVCVDQFGDASSHVGVNK